jgi:arylsulfatase A-like enzyme
VVTADHGDEFFEHGAFGHHLTLHEEVVRVPLLMRLPGRLPAGARIREPVSTLDVAPTILALAGVSAPAELWSAGLMPLLRGDEAAPRRGLPGRIVVPEMVTVEVPGRSGATPLSVVRFSARESWRRGPIKIVRERIWLEPPPRVPEPMRRAVEEESRRLHPEETLRWIDVERLPDEREPDWSSDFSDPRARAALEEFQAEYARMLRLRRSAASGDLSEPLQSALEALGYVEVDAPPRGGDAFVLPPPGQHLPRAPG